MKKIALLVFALMAMAAFGQERNYISTAGFKVETNENIVLRDYRVYKIDNVEEASNFLNTLVFLTNPFLDQGMVNYGQLGLAFQLFSVRDWSEEYVLMVITPVTRELEFNQPYSVSGADKTIIFEVAHEEPTESEFYFCRLLIRDKNSAPVEIQLRSNQETIEFEFID